jgi:hypothetical protein
VPLGIALLKGQVLAFDVAQLAETLLESVEVWSRT